jgi:penicillin-binding protein activator
MLSRPLPRHGNSILCSICTVLVASMFAGCTSTGVMRTSLDRERALSTDFDPDDLRATVEAMVDDLLTFPPVVELTSKGRPVLTMERLLNHTGQIDLDTKNITDAVRTQLLRSGRFRFKDTTTSVIDRGTIDVDNNGGLTDPDAAVQPGQQVSAPLYIYGAISEIETKAGRIKDVYYKITLNLKDIRSGELIWSQYKELRKERKRPIVGL